MQIAKPYCGQFQRAGLAVQLDHFGRKGQPPLGRKAVFHHGQHIQIAGFRPESPKRNGTVQVDSYQFAGKLFFPELHHPVKLLLDRGGQLIEA